MKRNIFVNGVEFDIDCLAGILDKYKEMFYGKNFKDAHHLSMAIMYANCATESHFCKSLKHSYNERCLKNSLQECK